MAYKKLIVGEEIYAWDEGPRKLVKKTEEPGGREMREGWEG